MSDNYIDSEFGIEEKINDTESILYDSQYRVIGRKMKYGDKVEYYDNNFVKVGYEEYNNGRKEFIDNSANVVGFCECNGNNYNYYDTRDGYTHVGSSYQGNLLGNAFILREGDNKSSSSNSDSSYGSYRSDSSYGSYRSDSSYGSYRSDSSYREVTLEDLLEYHKERLENKTKEKKVIYDREFERNIIYKYKFTKIIYIIAQILMVYPLLLSLAYAFLAFVDMLYLKISLKTVLTLFSPVIVVCIEMAIMSFVGSKKVIGIKKRWWGDRIVYYTEMLESIKNKLNDIEERYVALNRIEECMSTIRDIDEILYCLNKEDEIINILIESETKDSNIKKIGKCNEFLKEEYNELEKIAKDKLKKYYK